MRRLLLWSLLCSGTVEAAWRTTTITTTTSSNPDRLHLSSTPNTPHPLDTNNDQLNHGLSYPLHGLLRLLLITTSSALFAVVVGGVLYAFVRWWCSGRGSPLERGLRRREEVRRFELERLLVRPGAEGGGTTVVVAGRGRGRGDGDIWGDDIDEFRDDDGDGGGDTWGYGSVESVSPNDSDARVDNVSITDEEHRRNKVLPPKPLPPKPLPPLPV